MVVKFIHAADLHLGMRVTRFGRDVNRKVQEAPFEALDNVVNQARKREVDFVLIAGDLFDDNHVDAATSRRAAELLGIVGRPVFIIPGNHDPLTPDSVWERMPWRQLNGSCVTVLRTPEPVRIAENVILYPCPLTAKNSFDDPTRFIPTREPGDTGIRVGMAHGSLRDRDGLPEDDHLIARHAVDDKGLDYLALGHWHRHAIYADRAGIPRTAYSGVHEPMRFRGSSAQQTGWRPYSNSTSELFDDDGMGKVLLVGIGEKGTSPEITPLDVGHLRWTDETRELNSEDGLGELINELATRDNRERQLLRLTLKGILPAHAMLRLDELDGTYSGGQGGILSRYCMGELHATDLLVEPDPDELRQLVGMGILKQVHDRLLTEMASIDATAASVAREAQHLLYRLARDAQA